MKEGGNIDEDTQNEGGIETKNAVLVKLAGEGPKLATKGSLITFGVALFLHSFIDGLAVGVFNEIDSLTIIAISIILHKIPVAFTLGFTFASSE